MDKQGSVVVLTGPPGAGKTTVAMELAKRRSQCVLLDGDSFFNALVSGRIPPRETASDSQNRTVVRSIGAAVAQYAAGGFDVIVDGIIGPWMLDEFGPSVESFSYVVLRPSEAVAMERAQARSAPALVDEGPIAKMYGEFADLAEYEPNVVDSSDLDQSATIDAVEAAIKDRPALTFPPVDRL